MPKTYTFKVKQPVAKPAATQVYRGSVPVNLDLTEAERARRLQAQKDKYKKKKLAKPAGRKLSNVQQRQRALDAIQ